MSKLTKKLTKEQVTALKERLAESVDTHMKVRITHLKVLAGESFNNKFYPTEAQAIATYTDHEPVFENGRLRMKGFKVRETVSLKI